MSKRRGKNRPPKIGPPAAKLPPIVLRPCTSCYRLVDKTTMSKATDECARCWRQRFEASNDRSY